MKQALRCLSAALALAGFGAPALACYTVYNRANQVIYHAAAAPVDMRYPLHQTLPAVFPGGHLVFSITDTSCPAINTPRTGSVSMAVNSLPGSDQPVRP